MAETFALEIKSGGDRFSVHYHEVVERETIVGSSECRGVAIVRTARYKELMECSKDFETLRSAEEWALSQKVTWVSWRGVNLAYYPVIDGSGESLESLMEGWRLHTKEYPAAEAYARSHGLVGDGGFWEDPSGDAVCIYPLALRAGMRKPAFRVGQQLYCCHY